MEPKTTVREKRKKEKKVKEAETTDTFRLQVAPNGSRVEGQVDLPAVPRVSASKIWCFAIFPDHENQIGSIIATLGKLGKYFCAEELTPSTNRLHLQGWINFHKKQRPMESIKFFGRWEKAKGSWDDNYSYCALGDHGNKPIPIRTYTNMDILDTVIDPMEGLEYNWWQQYIFNMTQSQPDNRSIQWFYSPTVGKMGKTVFSKHLCMLDKHTIFVNGKAADIKCAVDKMIKKKISPRTVIFYFEKDSQFNVSYRAIESIKDGIFFSSKYESGMTMYNPPHVICFANWPPETEKLMNDRWVITDIEKEPVIGNMTENIVKKNAFKNEFITAVTKTKQIKTLDMGEWGLDD